ncbi:methylglyoxal synthase [Litorivicinus lipolyticus]|jgi:methylglyoxal synthase|uniref:Methylglyoxal synthase n=1 Tax=Litorivicinus lipolyticus TaxID=418701 RepID=A0A5Q2QA83_9GAMM|nr:methylglyoxal synthase [Litorivicinus lipolyticus]QGG79904.1 methylglyoxal synthase [Litorivicinus lipolyticus]
MIRATLPATKRIALVAHDAQKPALVEWALRHRAALATHELFATGTTAVHLGRALDLPVHAFLSGPMGGDQQIGARIAEASIDVLMFFWDPLAQMPHDPDVKALLRIAAVWNVPVACNSASADFLMSSPLMDADYEREQLDYAAYQAGRA